AVLVYRCQARQIDIQMQGTCVVAGPAREHVLVRAPGLRLRAGEARNVVEGCGRAVAKTLDRVGERAEKARSVDVIRVAVGGSRRTADAVRCKDVGKDEIRRESRPDRKSVV